ncbi:MAG: FkbM family methyltransferase [Afipia sp.]|jgi:FkbM family methyltransferase
MAQPPIEFDRITGAMRGASPWERTVGLALLAGSKVGALISHRGYNTCANMLKTLLPERNINVMLNPDATFSFPYGDGYWSKLLNRTFKYEDELELLLLDSRDVDYVLLDCGANYGYWSVMVSSQRFGSHRAIAIEPSSQNFPKLANNVRVNGNRFEAIKAAIGAERGVARLSGTKHEAFSIAGAADAGGEEVPVIALDNLIDDGKIPAIGKYLIKLDVEGVEVDAIKGGKRLLETDSMVICEEHGSDRNHTVSRYILENTPMKAIVHDPATDRFEPLTQLSTLDRIKVASHVGYNVFATASAFWEQRLYSMNSGNTRRAMTQGNVAH